MKMVLHKSWGTFTLPEEFCSLYGLTTFDEKEAIERTDERLIAFVEAHNAKDTKPDKKKKKLKVVEIPDEATDWEFNDYDGMESITYVVDGKIYHI